MIIEFYKRDISMELLIDHRLSEEEVELFDQNNGLKTVDKFSLRDNYLWYDV